MPPHDVIVTNPPYSDDHIPKILSICARSQKPWLILVPNYVYTKAYYEDVLTQPEGILKPFYIVPKTRYYYWTPEGFRDNEAKAKTSPFLSFWFLHMAEHTPSLIKWWLKEGVKAQGEEVVLARNEKALPCNVMGSYDVNRKRVRKKQREAGDRRQRKDDEERRKSRRLEATAREERQWLEFNSGGNCGVAEA